MTEAACGPDSPHVATMAGNLGGLYEQLGRYDEAQRRFDRALAIDEAALGPEHPSVAIDLNNLAGVHQATGRYLAARPLLEHALAIEVAARGEEHHEVAIALDNLGSVLSELGQEGPAEEFRRRALAVFEKTWAPSIPRLPGAWPTSRRSWRSRSASTKRGRSRSGLCGFVSHGSVAGIPTSPRASRAWGRSCAQGDFASALEAHRQAIELIQATYGPEHPLMAAALLDRAATERTLARHSRPGFSARRAIEIRQAALRAGHSRDRGRPGPARRDLRRRRPPRRGRGAVHPGGPERSRVPAATPSHRGGPAERPRDAPAYAGTLCRGGAGAGRGARRTAGGVRPAQPGRRAHAGSARRAAPQPGRRRAVGHCSRRPWRSSGTLRATIRPSSSPTSRPISPMSRLSMNDFSTAGFASARLLSTSKSSSRPRRAVRRRHPAASRYGGHGAPTLEAGPPRSRQARW